MPLICLMFSICLTSSIVSNAPEAKTYNPPAEESVVAFYAIEELRMMATALRCYWSKNYSIFLEDSDIGGNDNSDQHRSGKAFTSHCFSTIFIIKQLTAIENLITMLNNHPTESSHPISTIQDLLETFYMLDNTFAMFDNEYITFAIAFLCLCSIHPDGGFIDPRHITHYLSSNQYGVKYTLFVYAGRLWEDMRENTSLEELAGQEWFK